MISGACLGISGLFITLVQFSLKLLIEWGQYDGSWHFFFPFFLLPSYFSILPLFRNYSLEAYSRIGAIGRSMRGRAQRPNFKDVSRWNKSSNSPSDFIHIKQLRALNMIFIRQQGLLLLLPEQSK